MGKITDEQYNAAQAAMEARARSAYRGSAGEKAAHRAAHAEWEAVHALPERTFAERETRDEAFLTTAIRLGLLDNYHGTDRVIVETMPQFLRAAHADAGNRGVYPHNGAERIVMDRADAEALIESDPDWSEIIE